MIGAGALIVDAYIGHTPRSATEVVVERCRGREQDRAGELAASRTSTARIEASLIGENVTIARTDAKPRRTASWSATRHRSASSDVRVLVTGAAGMLGQDVAAPPRRPPRGDGGRPGRRRHRHRGRPCVRRRGPARGGLPPRRLDRRGRRRGARGRRRQGQRRRGPGNVAAAAAEAGAARRLALHRLRLRRPRRPAVRRGRQPSPLGAYGRTKLAGERGRSPPTRGARVARTGVALRRRPAGTSSTRCAAWAPSATRWRSCDDQEGCPDLDPRPGARPRGPARTSRPACTTRPAAARSRGPASPRDLRGGRDRVPGAADHHRASSAGPRRGPPTRRSRSPGRGAPPAPLARRTARLHGDGGGMRLLVTGGCGFIGSQLRAPGCSRGARGRSSTSTSSPTPATSRTCADVDDDAALRLRPAATSPTRELVDDGDARASTRSSTSPPRATSTARILEPGRLHPDQRRRHPRAARGARARPASSASSRSRPTRCTARSRRGRSRETDPLEPVQPVLGQQGRRRLLVLAYRHTFGLDAVVTAARTTTARTSTPRS